MQRNPGTKPRSKTKRQDILDYLVEQTTTGDTQQHSEPSRADVITQRMAEIDDEMRAIRSEMS